MLPCPSCQHEPGHDIPGAQNVCSELNGPSLLRRPAPGQQRWQSGVCMQGVSACSLFLCTGPHAVGGVQAALHLTHTWSCQSLKLQPPGGCEARPLCGLNLCLRACWPFAFHLDEVSVRSFVHV